MVFGGLEGVLGYPFGHVGGAVALLGHLLGSKMEPDRVHKGYIKVSWLKWGRQGVPEALQGSILRGFLMIFGAILECFWSLLAKGFVCVGR